MAGISGMHTILATAACIIAASGAAGWAPWQNRASTLPSKCRLPAETGVCRAFIPAYYYNVNIGSCDCFVYGGCMGNANRFGSLEECARECRVDLAAQISTQTCRDLFDEATYGHQQDAPPPPPPAAQHPHHPQQAIQHPPQALQHPPQALQHPPQALQHPPQALQHPPQALQHPPQALQHPPQALQHPPQALQHPPQALQHPPQALQHPPQALQHPPQALQHPPQALQHPPQALQHPPLATHHPPLALHQPSHVTINRPLVLTSQPVSSYLPPLK